jgi:hypothetical protein
VLAISVSVATLTTAPGQGALCSLHLAPFSRKATSVGVSIVALVEISCFRLRSLVWRSVDEFMSTLLCTSWNWPVEVIFRSYVLWTLGPGTVSSYYFMFWLLEIFLTRLCQVNFEVKMKA